MRKINSKRILSLATAAAIAVSPAVFTGCGKNTDTKAVSTATGGETELGGVTVKDGLINYYVYTAAVRAAYAQGDFVGDYASYDWEKKTDDGVKLDEKIKKSAFDEMAAKQLLANLAEEKGVKLSDDEIAEGEDGIEEFESANGEEALLTNIAALGLSSAEDYLELYKAETLYSKIEEDFAADPRKYTEGIVLDDYIGSETVTAKHILIKNDSENHDDPRATAEEVLEKAKAGADFNELMDEYNEDPGEGDAGYTFGKGEMVQEFEDAAFGLKCGEISGIVETEYGYHIIKRVAGMAEFKNYLLTAIDEKTEKNVMDKISVKDIMNDIASALNKIKTQQSASTAGDAAV